MTATEVVVDGLAFPECPRWRADGLWFSDQHAGTVHRIGHDGTCEVVAEVDGGPSGLGWLQDGTLVVVSMHGKTLAAFRPGADEGGAGTLGPGVVVADLAPFHPGLSNDMVVDAQGRCYVGNIGFDIYAGADPRPTVLVRVDLGPGLPSSIGGHPDAGASRDRVAPRVVADGLAVPNGMVITPDGVRLVVAESFAHQLTSFRILPDGGLADRRVFADLGDATPDGICLDADGGVWFASVFRGQVVRVDGRGMVTDRLATSHGQPVACMLGGKDRRTLYVTTSTTFEPDRSVAAASGAIEAIRVEVPGAGLP